MNSYTKQGGSRSVHVGGDASQNVIITGDQNVADVVFQKIDLPAPESVDIQAELVALREALAAFSSADQRKINNALADAEDELSRETPDKDEVGQALDRALDYAKKAEGFLDHIEQLQPHIANAASWLGKNWYKLLGVVGLTV